MNPENEKNLYPVFDLDIGTKKAFRALHISDTHLLFSDGRDSRRKYDTAMRRVGEYVFSNVGRNLPYFLSALLYAQKNCDILLHTGDLIDFCSEANLEAAQRLLALSGVDYFMCAGNHEYTHYSGQYEETEAERLQSRTMVPAIFRNDINFSARTVNGVRFVALYNCEGISETAVQHFIAETERALPVVLLVHDPFFGSGIDRVVREENGHSYAFINGPKENLTAEETALRERIRRMLAAPALKLVLAGHIHNHVNVWDELRPGLRQLTVGGGYYGCGAVLNFR